MSSAFGHVAAFHIWEIVENEIADLTFVFV